MLIKEVIKSVNESNDKIGDYEPDWYDPEKHELSRGTIALESDHKWFAVVDFPDNKYLLQAVSRGLARDFEVDVRIYYDYGNDDIYSPDNIDINWENLVTEHHDPETMITILKEAIKFKKSLIKYCKSHGSKIGIRRY